LLRRSQRAATLIESGHPIGRACLKAGVLESTANHRLALLDGRPDYLEGLHSVADDAAQNAFEWLNRSGRVVEILMFIGLGIVVGIFAISMYLPLFNIPRIVGHE
jgi:type II secretory pathway component PulF